MYPISNAVKALFDAEQRQVLRITGADRNGAPIAITEANVMENGFNIDRFSCNGNKLEVGTACSSELTLKLDNRQGQFNDYVFEGAELFVEIGIADWTQSNPTVTYIPCGYFICDEQPRSLSTITIKALDRMMRLDVVAEDCPWIDNNGNYIVDNNGNTIYFVDTLEFPCTVANLIQQVASNFLPFTQDLSGFLNYDLVISGLPALNNKITFRNIVQWCAGILGTCAYIDWNGELKFSWYDNSTGYTSTTANRFSSDLYENAIVITGVTFTDSDSDNKTVYLAGTDDYTLDVSGNPLITSANVNTVLQAIYTQVHDFAYTPFSADVINALWLWPMDRVTFTDRNGNGHVSSLTNVNHGINGQMSIAAKGETAQMNSSIPASPFTAQQLDEIRNIQRVNSTALKDAVDNATALITGADGGYVRFIYDENNKLTEIVIMDTEDITTATKVWRWNSGGLGYSSNGYAGPYTLAMTQNGAFVADFITSGHMKADRLQGGTLTLGGINNQNGLLEIRDSNDQAIVTGNKNGLQINNGSIYIQTSTGSYTKINESLPLDILYKYQSTSVPLKLYFDLAGMNLEENGDKVQFNGRYIQILAKAPTNGQSYSGLSIYDDATNAAEIRSNGWAIGRNNIFGMYCYSNYNNTNRGKMMLNDCDADIAGKLAVNGEVGIIGDLYVYTGTKNRVVSTDQYSDRLLYCYETPSPLFGDVGEGVIGEDGRCYVWLDPIFAQTIATDQYHVFLQKYGSGECWVAERRSPCFIVDGTPGLTFGWEIKAKQKDFDQRRLDTPIEKTGKEKSDYAAMAQAYIDKLYEGRIS